MLEVEELLDVVLRVPFAQVLEHVFVQSKFRQLTGSKQVGRGDDGRLCLRDWSKWILRRRRLEFMRLVDVRGQVICCGCVARITSDKDTTTSRGTDREAANSMFALKLIELSLLLPEFGAAFALGTCMWFG